MTAGIPLPEDIQPTVSEAERPIHWTVSARPGTLAVPRLTLRPAARRASDRATQTQARRICRSEPHPGLQN
ncbi:MAG: hypothetical protein M5U01_27055 [Ardenticatenaceae bacterium]|nr:hypothetical protein [Ardenticatenaceae bacterium]